MKIDQVDWSRAYEKAPPAFENAVRNALYAVRQQKDAKVKPRFMAAALAALMLLAFLSTAVAANFLGLGDFLGVMPKRVQTEFGQQGGDIGGVRARIRQAACDGVTLHMTVSFEAADPRDGVVYDLDWDFVRNAPRDKAPWAAGLADKERLLMVGAAYAQIDGTDITAMPQGHAYEDNGALVVDIVLDLRYSQTPDNELTVRMSPYVQDMATGAKFTGAFTAKVALDSGDSVSALAWNVPLQMAGYRIDFCRVTLTELGTYVTLEAVQDVVGEGPMSGSLWFYMTDESGKRVRFVGGEWYPSEIDKNPESDSCRYELYFPPLENMPDILTLEPFRWEDRQSFPVVELKLR